MRTEKELWQVVLNHQEYFKTGLCGWINNMRMFGILTDEESDLINYRIITDKRNIPFRFWLGEMFEIQPRIDWINNRIKELL